MQSNQRAWSIVNFFSDFVTCQVFYIKINLDKLRDGIEEEKKKG